jgi:hypothetical protein
VLTDPGHRVLEAVCRELGWPEAVGRPLAELIVPPELREQHRQGLRRYVTTGDPHVLDHRHGDAPTAAPSRSS